MSKIGLLEIGTYVPPRVLTNKDLAKMVDTTDEWIASRTGIKERRIAADDMHASTMGVEAAKECLSRLAVQPELLITSSGTAEKKCPYLSSMIANQLGFEHLAAFDVNAVCSGFVYGLAIAKSLMETANYQQAMVVATEKMSMVTDYKDRASCILFGDGAACVSIGRGENVHEIVDVQLGCDTYGSDLVVMGGPGDDFYFRQDGKKVYKFAITIMMKMINGIKERLHITSNDNLYVVPHQANYRMFEAVAKESGIPVDHFISSIDHYGNTSSSSIGLAFKEAWDKNRFKKGDVICLLGFGGGLSWGSAAIQW